MDLGILLIRAAVGSTLAAHGAQKLFGWFGGHGLAGTGQWLEMMGFRPGRRHALMAGLTEFVGGVLLAVGLLTPVGAVAVASVMLVAAITAHVKNGFFIARGGYEYNLVLGVAAIGLAFSGPGALSVDAVIGWTLAGPVWGIAALVTSAVGAALQLAQRKVQPQPQAAAA